MSYNKLGVNSQKLISMFYQLLTHVGVVTIKESDKKQPLQHTKDNCDIVSKKFAHFTLILVTVCRLILSETSGAVAGIF